MKSRFQLIICQDPKQIVENQNKAATKDCTIRQTLLDGYATPSGEKRKKITPSFIDRVGLKNQLENISSNNTFLINEKCNEVECYEMNERTQGFYISIFT